MKQNRKKRRLNPGLRTSEARLYQPIKERLQAILADKFQEFHLEITANKPFSNTLQTQVPHHKDIIFSFLNEAAPDITGFIKGQYSVDFLVAEIKDQVLKLEDIFQARKYRELYDARYALLISTQEIPEKLKRLTGVVPSLLSGYKPLVLARWDEGTSDIVEWFQENPFLKPT